MTGWVAPRWFDRLGGVAWRLLVIGLVLIMAVAGLVALSSIIVPIMLGLLFACGLHPMSDRLRRVHAPRGLAAGLPVLALLAALGLIGWLTISTVVDQWDDITRLMDQGRATIEQELGHVGIDGTTAEATVDEASEVTGSAVRTVLEGVVHVIPTVTALVASLVLSCIAAFFFARDGGTIWRWLVVRAGSTGELVDRIGQRAWTTLSGFVRGQAVIALIDATGIAVCAFLLGVPQPAAIFLLTFLGAFIPFIGAFLSGLVAVLLALGDSGLGTGLAMLAVVLAVQLIEGNVLQPWIQGRAVTLHPLVIALSVTAGGAVAGFLGVLLAVPVVACATVVLSELRTAGYLGGPSQPSVMPSDDG